MGKLKYKIIKDIGAVIITTGVAASCFNYEFPEVKNTPSDKEYRAELEALKTDPIVFSNQELYDYLLKKLNVETLTRRELNMVNTLVLNQRFENQDFSDFKYLPNLSKLYMNNNDLDCCNLYYNSELRELDISNGIVTNTASLPNSIKRVFFKNIKINDYLLSIPYNTYQFIMNDTSFNQLYIKNPEKLERVTISGDAFIDLSVFESCTNLKSMSITKCANMTNGSSLANINVEELELDDYATIWLDKDTVSKLNFETKTGNIEEEIDILDGIISDLNLEGKTNDEKRRAIITFVISKLQVDERINNNTESARDLKRFYYNLPIYYAVRYSDSISVNYSCLIQALCNRAGLNNYQLFSDNKTWNNINGMNVDALELDITGDNYYMSFNDNYNYQSNMNPAEQLVEITDIGYVDTVESVNITFNGENLKYKIGAYALVMFLINFTYLIATRNMIDDVDYEFDNEEIIEENKRKKEERRLRREAKKAASKVAASKKVKTVYNMSREEIRRKAQEARAMTCEGTPKKKVVKKEKVHTTKTIKVKKPEFKVPEFKMPISATQTKKPLKHRVVNKTNIKAHKIEDNLSLKLVNRI